MADADDGAQKAAAEAAAAVPIGFAKRKNRGNIRKRATEDELQQEEDDTQVVRKAKQQRGEPLAFTTKKEEKQDVLLKYESSRALPKQQDDLATRAMETETQFDRDGRALREKVLKQGEQGIANDGQYRGMNSYIDFRQGFRREHTIANEKGAGAHGPLRANVYVRTSARFDYQPDICKDYKETGFCSYGDSCKFLHDRGDYKSGWELDREFEEEQKRKREAMLAGWDPDKEDGLEGAGGSDAEDELPVACWTCRKPWDECRDPVVTRCKHYFCEKCALGSSMRGGRCGVCNEPTKGIFNVATDILKKLKRQQGQQGQQGQQDEQQDEQHEES